MCGDYESNRFCLREGFKLWWIKNIWKFVRQYLEVIEGSGMKKELLKVIENVSRIYWKIAKFKLKEDNFDFSVVFSEWHPKRFSMKRKTHKIVRAQTVLITQVSNIFYYITSSNSLNSSKSHGNFDFSWSLKSVFSFKNRLKNFWYFSNDINSIEIFESYSKSTIKANPLKRNVDTLKLHNIISWKSFFPSLRSMILKSSLSKINK